MNHERYFAQKFEGLSDAATISLCSKILQWAQFIVAVRAYWHFSVGGLGAVSGPIAGSAPAESPILTSLGHLSP